MIDFLFGEQVITISKPIHGNLNNIFTVRYSGYNKKEAQKRFKEAFKQEQSKHFINIP
jgi:hypothetical protein